MNKTFKYNIGDEVYAIEIDPTRTPKAVVYTGKIVTISVSAGADLEIRYYISHPVNGFKEDRIFSTLLQATSALNMLLA